MELGIDIGSISIGAVFIHDGKITATHYLPHKGDIVGTLKKILVHVPQEKVHICITGKDTIAHADILYVDPIVAITDGVGQQYPDANHILYIGGESYTLIHTKNRRMQNYQMNSSCASSTGAFLEQQATRLGMDIAGFAQCASQFTGTPPKVATRCAVFAKSDIIHLQQEGASVHAIAAGLCDSMVDGLVQALFKGNRLQGLTVLAGGVALNSRVTKALSQHLEKMAADEFSHVLGALGAALHAKKSCLVSPTVLENVSIYKNEDTRPVLTLKNSQYPDFSAYITKNYHDTEVTVYQMPTGSDVYLGIDIGSTSTKAVITAPDGDIWLGFYTRTAGKPVDAVKAILRCIQEVENEHGRHFHFLGAGTTGSGRKLMKQILHADLEVNEITAHAKAAVSLYPQVDTIIEIGGQDSKFTQLANGAVTNAVMNYVCAAGTGSFIEEQAKRLGIRIEEFAGYACQGRAPLTSERCTVYMERDINRLVRQGWSAADVAASVIYSVRDNYLNKVVAGAPVGEHVIFQGATARNKALVAAFEEHFKRPITVFPYAHLTGALGVCLMLKEIGQKVSTFQGLSFMDQPVSLASENCHYCHNNCRLTVIEAGEGKEAYGMMCGREYNDRKYVPAVKEHFDFVRHYLNMATTRGQVLIPCGLAMYEYLPIWRSFFQKLGFEVKVTKTTRHTFETGKQMTCSEFCAPILTAQGLVWELVNTNAQMIFFPVFYKEAPQEAKDPVCGEESPCFFCYYTSHLPGMVQPQLPLETRNKLVTPLLQMDTPRDELMVELHKHLQKYGLEKEEIAWAYDKSYQEFVAWKKKNIEMGKEIVSQIPANGIGLVILGRPYNTFDPVMNASLMDKITRLGYPTVYYEMLDMPAEHSGDSLLARIHWNYGKKIYRAAKFIAEADNLFPIYLTSFRCSPDAFIMSYFKNMMEHFKKPYLIVQLDEHCSDVGYLTRVEAAIDSFKNWRKAPKPAPAPPVWELETSEVSLDKTILIPHIDEIGGIFVAAAFESYGYKTVLLDDSPANVLKGSCHTLGGECMAIPAIIGGIIKAMNKYHLDPAGTVLFFPTSYIACNFPQFPVKISMALEKEGKPIKIVTPSSFNLMQRLLSKMDYMLWEIMVITHTLRSIGNSLRPYEAKTGETDHQLDEAVKLMREAIAQKKNRTQAWEKILGLFKSIEVRKCDRPKVLVTGDLYVKNNDAFNQNLVSKIEELGGEAISTSVMEYYRYGIERIRYEGEKNFMEMASCYVMKKIIESLEEYYYKPARSLITHIEEPTWDKIFASLQEMGIELGLSGETVITVSRAVALAKTGQIQAIVHVNPSFCCAGQVSMPLLEKLREDINIPVLHLFYDGTDQPNSRLVPFMHYLCQQRAEDEASKSEVKK